tara:strand:- start:532 stop:1188 length:657 start_codon:yes stop_codon:yes gene_type:complete
MALSRVNSNMIGAGDVSNTEHAYLNSVTSNVQTQIDGAGGGAWTTKVSETAFTNASSINITGLSKIVKIYIDDITISNTGNTTLRGRTSTNNGSSWSTDYNYKHLRTARYNDNTTYTEYNNTSGGNDNMMQLTYYVRNDNSGSNDENTAFAEITIFGASTSGLKTMVQTHYGALGEQQTAWYKGWALGHRNVKEAVNAFQVYPSSGTFSGSYSVLELA